RVAADAQKKAAPAVAAAPVAAAPVKPAIRLTNQDRAIAAVQPPAPVPAPAPAPKPVEAPVTKPAPALKLDAVKVEPSKADLASAVQKAASSFKHSPVGVYEQPPIDLFDAKV